MLTRDLGLSTEHANVLADWINNTSPQFRPLTEAAVRAKYSSLLN